MLGGWLCGGGGAQRIITTDLNNISLGGTIKRSMTFTFVSTFVISLLVLFAEPSIMFKFVFRWLYGFRHHFPMGGTFNDF